MTRRDADGRAAETVADLLGIGSDAEEAQQRDKGGQAGIGYGDLPAS